MLDVFSIYILIQLRKMYVIRPCIMKLFLVYFVFIGYKAYGQEKRIAVAGLFQVKELADRKCDETKTYIPSVMAIEAIKWTFKNLYESGDAPKIELIPFKTCGLSYLTTEATFNVLGGFSGDVNLHLAGIIGPEFSQEAKVMSEIITAFPEPKHIAQISYSSTASLLGNKTMFPNFFRVIPNDDKQVQTMVQLMLELKWNRIAIVHDDDLYGMEIVRSLEAHARDNGICVSTTQGLGSSRTNTDQYQAVLDEILINPTPSIKGLVFVGRQNVANLFMKFISRDSGITNAPAMIMCESVQLQRDAFSDSNGDIFRFSKGSFIVSPDYTEITEFAAYWKALFINDTLLVTENITNPWLLDVYEESFGGCRPDGSSNCANIEISRVEEQFQEQPLYIRYAIIAAYTIAAAITNIVTQKCSNEAVCQSFFDNTDGKDVLDQMNNLEISIGQDFVFYPQGLRNMSISFGPSSGDNQGDNLYKVYNLREAVSNNFEFVEVGVNDGFTMEMNKKDIVDYYYDSSYNFRNHTWPDVRKAQCAIDSICSECIPDDIKDSFLLLEGDLYVVALVPHRESDSKLGCGKLAESNLNGFGNSVAMLKAVTDFNNIAQFQGITVGLLVFDSCSNPTLSDWKIKNLMKSGLTLKNGTTIHMRDKILGVVASYFSSVSVAIAQTLTSLQMLHLAYGATSPALGNRDVYPFFMRVATPDNKQADVSVKLLKQLKINYIQLIYSEDAYGVGFRDSFMKLAEMEGICVVNRIGLSAESSSRINQVYQTLRNKPFAKLVVVVLSAFINEFIETVTGSMESGEFLFLGSESWGINHKTLNVPNRNKLLGSITVNLELADQYGLEEAMKHINRSSTFTKPWVENYLQTTMQCHYETSFNKMFPNECSKSFLEFWHKNSMHVSNWGSFSYLAVQSLLNTSGDFFLEKCSDKKVVCDEYRDNIEELIERMTTDSTVSINGQTSKVFDHNGDGNIGYVVYNIQRTKTNPAELDYVEIGRYTSDGSFVLREDLIVNPTQDSFQSVCPNPKACAECLPASTSLPPIPTSAPQTTAIALGSVLGVLVVVVIVLVIVVCCLKGKVQMLKAKGDGYITPTEVSKHYNNSAYAEQFDTVGNVSDQSF